MSTESPEKNVNPKTNLEDRVKRAQEFVGHLLAGMDSWHNHKENMAHAAIVVMLALCGGILSTDAWPPKWIESLPFQKPYPCYIAFFSVLFLWVLIHIYMRWQLLNRRQAAIKYNGALRALAEWVSRNPSEEDLTPYHLEKPKQTMSTRIGAKFLAFVDRYVFPFERMIIYYDIGKECYPAWLGKAVQETKQKTIIRGERLVTSGSFFIFIIIVIRMLS